MSMFLLFSYGYTKSKRSFYDLYYPLPPVFFSPCTKFLSVHILNILFKHPILSRDVGTLENVQKLALKFVKELRHEQLSNNFDYSLVKADESVVIYYSFSKCSVVLWNSPWSSPSPIQPAKGYVATPISSTNRALEMLHPLLPIHFHDLDRSILEQTAG